MKEISDNDARALELLREKMALEAKRDGTAIWGIDPASAVQVHNTSETKADRDRIEQIDFALEEWAKGEDILVAMLSDPREDKPRDVLNYHHTAWQKQAMLPAQTLGVQSRIQSVTSGQIAAQNALDAFARAAAHFAKEQK